MGIAVVDTQINATLRSLSKKFVTKSFLFFITYYLGIIDLSGETIELYSIGEKAPHTTQREQTYMTEFFRHSSGVEEELWSLHEVEGRNIDTMSALEK